MAGRLQGKSAVITAAGQGIGRAIAEAFIDEGATVCVCTAPKTDAAGTPAAGTEAVTAEPELIRKPKPDEEAK